MISTVAPWPLTGLLTLGSPVGDASVPETGGSHALVVDASVPVRLDCLNQEAIRAAVAEALDTELGESDDDAKASIRLEPMTQGWRVEIEVEIAGTSLRTRRALEIADSRCEEIADTITLVLALLVDELWAEQRTVVVPERAHPEVTEPPTPEPPPPEPPVREPAPPTLPESASPAAGPRWTVDTGVEGVMSVRDLPGVAAGTGLRSEVSSPHVWSFGVRASVWPLAQTAAGDGGDARFTAFDGGLFVCPRFFERAVVQLAACLGPRAGVLLAQGRGFDETLSARRPRALIDAELGARFALVGPLRVRLGVGLAIPLVRDRFVVQDAGELARIHRAWPVVPTANLSIELHALVHRSKRGRSGGRAVDRKAPTAAFRK